MRESEDLRGDVTLRMSPAAICTCAAAVQPLVFETGVREAPLSTAGTGFLVVTAGRGFVIKARHLMGLNDLSPMCIFPTATSQRLIPLRNVFYIPKEKFDDDFSDFVIVEIDIKRLDLETDEGTAIDLGLADADWLAVRESSAFTVIGYPLEQSISRRLRPRAMDEPSVCPAGSLRGQRGF